MADISVVVAGVVLALGISLHFSLHKLEEGHVGVYYRVSTLFFSVLTLFLKQRIIPFTSFSFPRV
jgi:hypothetical protein